MKRTTILKYMEYTSGILSVTSKTSNVRLRSQDQDNNHNNIEIGDFNAYEAITVKKQSKIVVGITISLFINLIIHFCILTKMEIP